MRYILFIVSYFDDPTPSEAFVKSFDTIREAIKYTNRIFKLIPYIYDGGEMQTWHYKIAVNRLEYRNKFISRINEFQVIDSENGEIIYDSDGMLKIWLDEKYPFNSNIKEI